MPSMFADIVKRAGITSQVDAVKDVVRSAKSSSPAARRLATMSLDEVERGKILYRERAFTNEANLLMREVIDRAERAVWLKFDSDSDNDCSYFGTFQYQNTQCTDENLSRLQFATDIYHRARMLAKGLLATDPDTFGLLSLGIDYKADPKLLDSPCPRVKNPSKPDLVVTWRGYARMLWFKLACRATSAAYWATNVRTGFLYGIGKPADATDADVLGSPWVHGNDELWAWGPARVKRKTADWWGLARSNRKHLFLPLPTQAFMSASQDPGLDQPWLWGAEGQLIDTQRMAEYKRGRRRRKTRRAERRRAGWYARPMQWDALGGGRNQCPKKPWKEDGLRAIYDPAYSLPPDFALGRLFSTEGQSLTPVRAVVGRGDRDWLVPSGPLLLEYTREWLHEVADQDIVDHLLRANLYYVDYLKRFMEKERLSNVDPEVVPKLRAQNAVFVENGVEYVMWIPSMGLTLQQMEKMTKELQKARSMKIAGQIASPLYSIGIALLGSGNVYGIIVGVILIVVAALIQLFTWIFGGRLVGCPKAPRPFTLRTFDDPACNTDIAQTDQTIGESFDKLELSAAQVGIRLAFPKSAPPPPPPPAPQGAAGDFQLPVLELPNDELEPGKSSLVPALVFGGLLATGAYLLLKR